MLINTLKIWKVEFAYFQAYHGLATVYINVMILLHGCFNQYAPFKKLMLFIS